jgi:hypothetical protein
MYAADPGRAIEMVTAPARFLLLRESDYELQKLILCFTGSCMIGRLVSEVLRILHKKQVGIQGNGAQPRGPLVLALSGRAIGPLCRCAVRCRSSVAAWHMSVRRSDVAIRALGSCSREDGLDACVPQSQLGSHGRR